MRLGRRPRRVPGLGPRFTRALGSVADAPGRSLATIGADSGPVSSVIAGIERLGGALLNEGFERRREAALYEADQVGADEGARTALEGHLVELREDDTESARVFNTALQASYFANLDLAVADKADALAIEHSADPEAFSTRYDGVREGVLANLPPEWRGEAAVELEKRRRLYLRDITANALDQAESGANADLIRAMDGYAGRAFDAARRDKDGFEDQTVKWSAALEARTDLSAQAKEEAKLSFEAETRRHAVLGDFETALEDGSANGEAFIDRFAETDDIADPDERARLAGEMHGMLRTVQAQEKRVADEAKAAADIEADTRLANLDISVRTAKTRDQLDAAHQSLQAELERGTFAERPDKYADFVVALDKREETYGKKIDGHRNVAAVLGGDKPAMPGDDTYRKNVDDYYDDVLAPALGQAEPADASELRVETVRRTGHVPKTVRAEWESAFAAGNADQKALAADEVARAMDSPAGQAAVERLSSDTKLRAMSLHKLRMAGMDADAAVEAVEARMDPKNKAAQEAAKVELKEHRKNYDTWLKDHFDPTGPTDFLPFGESNDAALPPSIGARAELVEDFSTLFEDAFLVARDAESAKAVALSTLDRSWGVTRAEGAPRAIKYPPERFYPIEADALSRQLVSDVEAAMTGGHPGMQDVKPEIDGLQLVPDSRTAREASTGRPTWAVTVIDENGIFQPVLGESGLPMRWAPDAAKAADEKTRKAMEKVRRLRKEGARGNPERSRGLGNAALVDALNSGYDAIRKRAKGGE